MYLRPTPDTVRTLGRIRWHDGVPYLGNAGSFLEFVVTASHLTVELDTMPSGEYASWLSLRLNEEEQAFPLEAGGRHYLLFHFSSPRKTTVRLLKRSESGYGSVGVLGFETDAISLHPTPARTRRLEFIGDSITCGFGVAQRNGEPFDTSGENCAAAYAIRAAEMLDADWHLVAQSGIGVYSSCVDEAAQEPNTQCLMPMLYPYTDLSCDEIRGWEPEKWDFSRWRPHLIVVNLGTNDALFLRRNRGDVPRFGEAYARFLRTAAGLNPGSQILCVLGVMDAFLCKEAACQVQILREEGLPISFLRQTPQSEADGMGAAGHPSALTQEKSARELAAVIQSIMGWNTMPQ